MSGFLQSGAQGGEVVDFAIQHYGDGAVLVKNRLAARNQVDDAQATVSQRGAARGSEILTLAVWTAVRERPCHRADGREIDDPVALQSHLSGNPAHVVSAPRRIDP